MKKILFAILAFSYLGAETITIIESPGRTVEYETVPQTAAKKLNSDQADQSAKQQRYLRYGEQEVITTGSIIVSFTGAVDIDAFAAKYQLANGRELSQMFVIWVFDNHSELDDLHLCAKIGAEEPSIRYAKPDFQANISIP